MAIKVSPSAYRKGQIAIAFGRGLIRHISEAEAETLGMDLIDASANAQIDRVNRQLVERRLRAEKEMRRMRRWDRKPRRSRR